MKIIDELRLAFSTSIDQCVTTHYKTLAALSSRSQDFIRALESRMASATTANEVAELVRCGIRSLATDWVSVVFGMTEASRLKQAYLRVLNDPKFSDLKLLIITNQELMAQNAKLESEIRLGRGDSSGIHSRVTLLEGRAEGYERQLKALQGIRDDLIAKNAHLATAGESLKAENKALSEKNQHLLHLLEGLSKGPGFEDLVKRAALSAAEKEEVLRSAGVSEVAKAAPSLFGRC